MCDQRFVLELISKSQFMNFVEFKQTIPMTSIQGDIGNLQQFSRAVKGADCVIHVAGVISIGTYPNTKVMRAVNVDGKSKKGSRNSVLQ